MRSPVQTAVVTALLLVIATAGPLRAQGESGAACLIIPPSARANGMGQTYVAIADDATGIWWNPAGLAFVDKTVDIMYSQLVPELASDVKYAYFAGTSKIEGLGTIGASLIYLGYGDWEARDPSNNYLGQYSSWEAAPTLSGAVQVVRGLGVGMNVKFIYIDLAPPEATISALPRMNLNWPVVRLAGRIGKPKSSMRPSALSPSPVPPWP